MIERVGRASIVRWVAPGDPAGCGAPLVMHPDPAWQVQCGHCAWRTTPGYVALTDLVATRHLSTAHSGMGLALMIVGRGLD
jgi:hypothetical protein